MFRKFLVAGSLLALAGAAQSQSTANLMVTGTVSPTACALTLGGGGTAAFGRLAAVLVKTWGSAGTSWGYFMPETMHKPVGLTVLCPTPTKVALSFTDNRAATAAPSAAVDATRYGLGTYTPPGGTATNIGSFFISAEDLTVKTSAAAPFVMPAVRLTTPGLANSSSVWTAGRNQYLPAGQSIAFAVTPGSTTPDSIVNITGTLSVGVQLQQAVVDSATTDIVFDGSATVTLVGL